MMARILTPEEFGAFFLIFSWVSFGALACQLGMKQTIVRLFAESKAQNQFDNIRNGLKLAFIICLSGIFLATTAYLFGIGKWLFGSFLNNHFVTTFVWWSIPLWIGILTFRTIVVESFRGLNDLRDASLFDTFLPNILVALVLYLIFLLRIHLNLSEIISITLFFATASCVFAAYNLIKKVNSLPKNKITRKPFNIFSVARSMYIIDLSVFALNNANLWILGWFLTADQVAIFGAAARLVNLVAMPLLIINLVVPPIIAEMNIKGDKEKLQNVLQKSAFFSGIPALFLLVLYIFQSPYILRFIYGDFYIQGTSVLIILSIGSMANVWSGSCGKVLIMTGHHDKMLFIMLASGTINIIGAIVMVNNFGIVGVAVSASFAKIFQNIVTLIVAKRSCGIWTHIPFRVPFLSA